MVRLSFQLKRLRLLGIGGLGLLISVAIALGPIALPAPATTEPSAIAATEPVEPGIDPLAAGRTYYQAGQFAVAIEQWQTAVQQASRQGDLARQIMGWNSIASAQQVLITGTRPIKRLNIVERCWRLLMGQSRFCGPNPQHPG